MLGSRLTSVFLSSGVLIIANTSAQAQPFCPGKLLTGAAVLASGWKDDAPLVCRRITLQDLPPPGSGTGNSSNDIAQPTGAAPLVPPGFRVTLAYQDSTSPRLLHTAPNGDIFVSESNAGQIRVLRPDGHGGFSADRVFASGLSYPFGVAFYPPGANPTSVYVAQTNQVVRYPYVNGDLTASAAATPVGPVLPSGGNHISRDVVFSATGKTMFVSVGSASNDQEAGQDETLRANILSFGPDGSNRSIYASGIRNPVSLAIDPHTGFLWTSVNERDQLGDNLVPDYVTHVVRGGFYGWPWYYIGGHVDPRHVSDAPGGRVQRNPDVLLQAHSASLGMAFTTGTMFPAEYRGGAFVAEHGSWNRANRNGSKVIYVRPDSHGSGIDSYKDFMTGFTVAAAGTPDGTGTWGKPVGIAFGNEGAMYVSDDVGNRIWRITYAP